MTTGYPDDGRPRRQLVQDLQRLEDVERKHDRVRQLLSSAGADALLLQDPANIAWFTAGVDVFRCSSENCQTSVFITDEARLFATNAVDATQIFEREAFGLGFQLKQREWFQPHAALVDDLSRGRRVISDTGAEGTRPVARRIARLRLPLTRLEVQRLRRLSKVLVHAVEVTAGNIRAGQTEAAVAGEISHRLLKRTVTPVRLQVCADGRNARYRHWTFSEDPIEAYATVACVARRWGLHVAVARTVALNNIPDRLRDAHQQALLAHATGLYFSRHGQTLQDVWTRVRRIYEKFGLASEWQLADQADVLGYRSSEVQLTPDCDFQLQPPVAMYWHPSAGPALLGDSILVNEHGSERLTQSDSWPQLIVKVKGHSVPCPGILRIAAADSRTQTVASQPEDHAAAFAGLNFDDEDESGSRVDSVWELDLTSDRSVFDEDDSTFSEESVLD